MTGRLLVYANNSSLTVSAISTQIWPQKEPSGGRPCYRRRSQEVPRMLHPPAFMNPTLTPLSDFQKTRPRPTPRALATSPASHSRSLTRASAMTPTTTPCWSPSLTSRPAAGPWRCRARVDSRRSEGCAPAFPYKTKILRPRRPGKRRYGDGQEEREVVKDFCNNGLKLKQGGFEYMKVLKSLLVDCEAWWIVRRKIWSIQLLG